MGFHWGLFLISPLFQPRGQRQDHLQLPLRSHDMIQAAQQRDGNLEGNFQAGDQPLRKGDSGIGNHHFLGRLLLVLGECKDLVNQVRNGVK